MDSNSTGRAGFSKELAGADRAYVALPPAATSTTTQWHEKSEVEALWMLCGAYLLVFGQAGFALLEAGHVRSTLARQVAIKVLLQVCIVALTWWAVGYPFAFGEGGPFRNSFIGGKDWFLPNSSTQPNPNQQPELFPLWMLHFAYCTMAVAVASCALAERGTLVAHVLLAVVMSCWIYPVIVHWVWSTEGWLSARRSYGGPVLGANGFIDCAGSAVVHITAGATGLAGAWLIGPRQCMLSYSSGSAASSSGGGSGSSLLLSALGGMFIWLSWYGLAPSNVVLTVSSVLVAARVSVAVTLAAAAGCLGVFSMQLAGSGLSLRCALDGALAGLVAISASCAVVELYAAFVIGLVGGAAYLCGLRLMSLSHVDDPVHVAAVHLLPGIWGAVAPGIFATPALLPAVGYPAPAGSSGIFYKGDGKQLGIQLLGSLVVLLWSLGLSLALFHVLKVLKCLRVPAASEGIGWHSHGGAESSDAAQPSPSLSGIRRQPRQSSKSGVGPQRTHSSISAQQQLHLQQQSRTQALCADDHCMGDMDHLMADTKANVCMPSIGIVNAEWSYHASRASSTAGGLPAMQGMAGNDSYHGTNSGASSRQSMVPELAAAQLGAASPSSQRHAQALAAAAAAVGGTCRSWSEGGSAAAVAGAFEGLRVTGSSNNPADVSLCMMPASGLPAGLRPCPYVPPASPSNTLAVAGPGRATAGLSSLRAHSVTALPKVSARFWSAGGSQSASPSPDFLQVGVRAGSMLVLAPGGGSSSSIYHHGGALGWRLQQDASLLQQQAQRSVSSTVQRQGQLQQRQQQQQQQHVPAQTCRVPGGHATVSRAGSVVSAAGSISGRCMAAGLQPHDCGGYSSSHVSRASSPAEISPLLDLRKRSLVAASAASLEGRRPASPLGQSLPAAGVGNVASMMGVADTGAASQRESGRHVATAAGSEGETSVVPVG